MTSDERLDRLVDGLAAGLRPVPRLRSPGVRATGWIACVVALGAVLWVFAGRERALVQLTATPDLRIAAGGALLTAVLAAVAAFELCLPDRSRTWALVPLPAAALWLGASGWGCLRSPPPGLGSISLQGTAGCLGFILGVSVPLSAVLLVLLARAHPLQPGLVAVVAGLAAAAGSAVLLTLFHPFDASWTDLSVHVVAVGLVVLANRAFAPRVLI